MRGTFVDIENEFSDVSREVEMLRDAIALFEGEARATNVAWRWLAIQGLGSGVEKIYTGCERVMAKIAAEIDGSRIERNDGWHISLLKRMAHPFPGRRDAVITPETFNALDRLRSFRHRERNTYGLTLDADIVLERAKEIEPAFRRFEADLEAFFRQAA